MRERQKCAGDVLCEVALILAPWLRCTWSDLPRIAPAILFVSHSIRHAFLETMQNTIAYYPCFSLTYELHVHATRPRHPGRTPQMPLHWVVRSDDHEHAMDGCVTTLWRRSRHDFLHVHEDAWDVMPSLHDGSTGSYDFDTLLFYLDMVSLSHFYNYDVVPTLRVVQWLTECDGRYVIYTYQQGLQRLSLVPDKKKES
jgi:hypothetical protein